MLTIEDKIKKAPSAIQNPENWEFGNLGKEIRDDVDSILGINDIIKIFESYTFWKEEESEERKKEFIYAMVKTNNYSDFMKVLEYFWFSFTLDMIMLQHNMLEETFENISWSKDMFIVELKAKFNHSLDSEIDDFFSDIPLVLSLKDKALPEKFDWVFNEMMYNSVKNILPSKYTSIN